MHKFFYALERFLYIINKYFFNYNQVQFLKGLFTKNFTVYLAESAGTQYIQYRSHVKLNVM